MKWEGRRQSGNIEDRRGMSGGGKAALGGGGLIVAALMLYSLFTGNDTSMLMGLVQNLGLGGGSQQTEQRELTPEEIRQKQFVATIVADTEDVWATVLKQQLNMTYAAPTLVMFTGSVQTACGGATAAVGPFYCPGDQKVYLDMDFFDQLRSQFGAKVKTKVDGTSGDFAVAYVIAHEIGHHIQNLLGTSGQEQQLARSARSKAQANKYSVALELQADFYAGIFTHYDQKMNNILEAGDIEGAISAAQAVGDDAIQKKMQGTVVPESFTHGSSEQRVYWFTQGYKTGDMRVGDYQTIYNSNK